MSAREEELRASEQKVIELEKKLEISRKENEKLAERLCYLIGFMRWLTERLEKTKRSFKSKEIAKVREDIEKKIVEILMESEDIEVLKSWTKEWASGLIKKLALRFGQQ